ncbi:MAG TPA: carboxypeptidase-like regulatory domain-containing protein, partial [Bacteroidales bacterium]|nr:carboxypeptidase-like regulatory domain-containing protein [Bacteroidales bacterium]
MKPYLLTRRIRFTWPAVILTAIFFVAVSSLHAQDKTTVIISGTVRDNASQELLPGVNVTIKGTQTGTVTDINGRYSIETVRDSTLLFSFIGYESQEVNIGDQKKIDVSLNVLIESLSEVVVIGYGTTTRKEVTGSIATIKT